MKISINGLFNQFNYTLDIADKGMTIITGPNGFGKSTILRMIKNLSSGFAGIIGLRRIPFSTFTVENDNYSISIKKTLDTFSINNKRIKLSELDKIFLRYARRSRYIYNLDETHVIDKRTDRVYTIEDYLEKLFSDSEFYVETSEYNSLDNNIIGTGKEVLKECLDIPKLMGDVFFLEEQRLIKKDKSGTRVYNEEKVVNTIDELPTKMKDIFSSSTTKYSSFAAGLDSTFPNRLFEEKVPLEKDQYDSEMKDFVNKYKQMKKYELANLEFKSFKYNPEYGRVLKVYFEDFQSKYNIYRELIEKLDLFMQIVNSRLNFKKIVVSKDYGIKVLKDNSEEELLLSSLSSGEQQEIVLFFELIFETPNNSLLLIDEPEISLHVAWQKKFIDDLTKVLSMNGSSAIIATHSPQIIDSRWEITTDLGEQYELSSSGNN